MSTQYTSSVCPDRAVLRFIYFQVPDLDEKRRRVRGEISAIHVPCSTLWKISKTRLTLILSPQHALTNNTLSTLSASRYTAPLLSPQSFLSPFLNPTLPSTLPTYPISAQPSGENATCATCRWCLVRRATNSVEEDGAKRDPRERVSSNSKRPLWG